MVFFYAMVAVMVVEIVLMLAWNPLYFGLGIRLFSERIPATAEMRERLVLNCLERDVATYEWIPMLFRPLPGGRMAFRESFFLSGAKRYYPVMRGLVVVDARRNQVRVEGICNWMTLGIAVLCVAMPMVATSTWPMLLILGLFVYCYFIQRRRYHEVAEALREQMRTELPEAIMQLRRRVG
ncbi:MULTISPECIES: hypothetical protein [Stenotrophomonas]|uniref:hypothetical protein n=1 Tax=Stenotrophomonas TaxID=40323 RepID=UPI00087323F8|nr:MULTISPECIES: hypothetical protein [Stenotrophomonas]OEZ00360.1 hypothetical protein BIY45_11855 [Stenotrophomonas sp. BIIR7]